MYRKKLFSISFLIGCVALLAACEPKPYKNRIGVECDLLEHLKVTLSSVEIKQSIQAKQNPNNDDIFTIEKNDCHYICCSFDFKCDNATGAFYKFSSNKNFKLKDHAGAKLPSNQKLPTTDSIVDYSWLNSTITTSEEKQFIVYFETSTKYSYQNMDLYVEVDLSLKTNDGVDILLKE